MDLTINIKKRLDKIESLDNLLVGIKLVTILCFGAVLGVLLDLLLELSLILVLCLGLLLGGQGLLELTKVGTELYRTNLSH